MTDLAMKRFTRLRLDGVTRRFAGLDALTDLNLTIEKGEFIALLGPSGCGKSTALNCLAGLLPLSDGQIWEDETRLDTLPPERRGFGMVFQNYALFPHLTVRKNVAFGLQMRRLPRAEVKRRTDAAIQLVRLEEHANKLPGQLSGGQQQRVAIARAVVIEPSLVLMDEPLSNLDAKLRLEMRTEIRRLHQSLGLTTIYVTHDQEEALSMADRLVVLRAGRVQQIGSPEELHARPANWHVADFMGFRNLLPLRAGAPAGETIPVEGSGLLLHGTPVGPIGAGSPVVAAVRPEDVRVVGPGGAPDTATPQDGQSARSPAPQDARSARSPAPQDARSAQSPAPQDARSAQSPAPQDARSARSPAPIPVTVEVTEYQGREVAVDVRTADDTTLHLRTTERYAPGSTIWITVDPARLLVFPADGGDG